MRKLKTLILCTTIICFLSSYSHCSYEEQYDYSTKRCGLLRALVIGLFIPNVISSGPSPVSFANLRYPTPRSFAPTMPTPPTPFTMEPTRHSRRPTLAPVPTFPWTRQPTPYPSSFSVVCNCVCPPVNTTGPK